MFPGFATRLKNSIKEVYKKVALKDASLKEIKIPIEVVDSPRRKISVFIGACVISQIYNVPSYNHYWITKEFWDENGGERSIKEKCKNLFQ